MAKAKAKRGAKAAFVREGVRRYAHLMPKALADKLNEEARDKGLNLGEIKGQEISKMKLLLRKAGATPQSAPATPAATQQPVPTSSEAVAIEDLRALKELTERLGKHRLRDLLELLT